MIDSFKWGYSWSAHRDLHFAKQKYRFFTKNCYKPPSQKTHNTFRRYMSKYLCDSTWLIVSIGVIRDQFTELYILQNSNFDFGQKIFLCPSKQNNTFRSYKYKYLSNGTWCIVTSGVIRDQLAELYIVTKRNLDFKQKNFWDPYKNTIHLEVASPNISVTVHDR